MKYVNTFDAINLVQTVIIQKVKLYDCVYLWFTSLAIA